MFGLIFPQITFFIIFFSSSKTSAFRDHRLILASGSTPRLGLIWVENYNDFPRPLPLPSPAMGERDWLRGKK
jgi:hypothetical protein